MEDPDIVEKDRPYDLASLDIGESGIFFQHKQSPVSDPFAVAGQPAINMI